MVIHIVKKQWVILVSLVLCLVLGFGIYYVWPYRFYIAPTWEKMIAPRAASPLDAYDKFRETLKTGDSDQALQYVVREKRSHYRSLLKDLAARERLLNNVSNLSEYATMNCEDQVVCTTMAIYTYDHKVTEPYWEEVMGKRFLVQAGTRHLEMTFVELKPGYWQISEL